MYLTWENDDEFVVFLRGNDRKLVALNLSLDASVATEKQHKIITANKEVFDQIRLCNLNDLAIPLPHRGSEFIYLKFHFCDPQYQVYSSGGTGVFTLPIKGIFEVLQTLHGGPSTIFHLKEVVAPIDIQVRAFGG